MLQCWSTCVACALKHHRTLPQGCILMCNSVEQGLLVPISPPNWSHWGTTNLYKAPRNTCVPLEIQPFHFINGLLSYPPPPPTCKLLTQFIASIWTPFPGQESFLAKWTWFGRFYHTWNKRFCKKSIISNYSLKWESLIYSNIISWDVKCFDRLKGDVVLSAWVGDVHLFCSVKVASSEQGQWSGIRGNYGNSAVAIVLIQIPPWLLSLREKRLSLVLVELRAPLAILPSWIVCDARW